MPRPKPPFTGDTPTVRDFSNELRQQLRSFYPDQPSDVDLVFGDAADSFVEELLSEARWATAELAYLRLEVPKDALRAEQRDILKALESIHIKLGDASLELTRLLSPSADLPGFRDAVARLACDFRALGDRIHDLPSKPRIDARQHEIALELAVRIIHVLTQRGLSTVATYDDFYERPSDSITILKLIGDDVGLRLAPKTWKKVVLEAKSGSSEV